MGRGRDWLVTQNQLRHEAAVAKGTAGRVDRGGKGRALARKAWSERRSRLRWLRRRRVEVVGRVRLWGKGPPPRPGPLNRRPATSEDIEWEPVDEALFKVAEDHWREQDEFMAKMREFKASQQRLDGGIALACITPTWPSRSRGPPCRR